MTANKYNDQIYPWAKPAFLGNEEEYAADAVRSLWISGGPYVEQFESELAKQMGVTHALAVCNGTVAIHLSLLGLGIGRGDEVIVPAYTFVAAVNMAIAVGATPVPVDVDPDTWLMDSNNLERAITPRTKAIIPVHLYGNVADMPGILAVAEKHNIPVIEDAAEAAFSTFGGSVAGTLGHVGTLSFHATKTITTGEGGAVLTNNEEAANRMRVIRDHGMRTRKRYWHEEIGYNFRITNMQAAIGVAQLQSSTLICEKRRHIMRVYQSELKNIPDIRAQSFSKSVKPVLWAMAVRLRKKNNQTISELRDQRDMIIQLMGDAGIETRPGFYSLDLLPPYEFPEFTIASELSASVISLPTFLELNDDDIVTIVTMFSEIVSSALRG